MENTKLTAEEWSQHLTTWKQSGYSVRKYTNIKSLPYHAFNYWKRRLEGSLKKKVIKRKPDNKHNGFVKLDSMKMLSSHPEYWMSMEMANGKVMHFYSSLEIGFLKELSIL